MSKVIKCNLSVIDLGRAINELKAYENELNDKLQRFVEELMKEGVTVAQARLGATIGDSTNAGISYGVNSSGEIISAYISLDGPDALFIEFGAGIAYNTGMQHPDAAELGYGPGTYPSKHPPNKAIIPGRWIYGHNDDGSPKWSIGTQASMPIYNAAETVRNNAIRKALEIFRS